MKKNTSLIILCLLLLAISGKIIAQSNQAIDSLRQYVTSTDDKSKKLDALIQLFGKTKRKDFETAEIYGHKALKLAQSIKDVPKEADMYNKLGLLYAGNYKNKKAMTYYELSRDLFIQEGNRELEGVVYNNIGLNYGGQKKMGKELIFHHKALAIFKAINNKDRQAMSFINIGNVHARKKDWNKALSYYEKAQPIYEKNQDYRKLSTCLNNIASINYNNKNYAESYKTFKKVLKVYEILGSRRGRSMILYNMSAPLLKLKRYDESNEALTRALKILIEDNNEEGLAICYSNFGVLNLELGNFNKAEEYFILSIKGAKKTKMLELEIENYNGLADLYEKKGQYKLAFKYYKKYAVINDSIHNERIETINKVERKLINEKNKQELELMNKENEIKSYKTRIIIAVGIGFILVLFIGIFSLFKKYQLKNRSNKVLAEKNQLIEEKSREITDSINYAKRIQSAILPPDKFIKEHLPDCFVLYKPKDIVAGDFYWVAKQDGKVLFAAADCTGHGVPGAMVSVVCNSALYQSVREHKILDPGKILDKTREIIVREFEKGEEEVKDGMDIALCSLEDNCLEYAGAHNPLWIIRNGELIETKATKQPIGQFDNIVPFTTHKIELRKNDTIYLFSDGYVDQFGGEKGKKFKSKAFKELLLSIYDKPMEEQKSILDSSFENWRKNLEQVDDVCVIGVRY